MILTRRSFNTALASTALVAAAGLSPFELIGRALADDAADPAALATPSPLGDMMIGQSGATVTIIEYASMTCPHCAEFDAKIFPTLKSEYIDTGKVKFIFREYPLDQKAAAGSQLARCIGKGDPNKYFAVVDILFKTQDNWIPNDTVEAFHRIGRQAGLSDQATDSCISDQATLDAITQTRQLAYDKLKVDSTPTFFINGTVVKGAEDIEKFRSVIDPLLKS